MCRKKSASSAGICERASKRASSLSGRAPQRATKQAGGSCLVRMEKCTASFCRCRRRLWLRQPLAAPVALVEELAVLIMAAATVVPHLGATAALAFVLVWHRSRGTPQLIPSSRMRSTTCSKAVIGNSPTLMSALIGCVHGMEAAKCCTASTKARRGYLHRFTIRPCRLLRLQITAHRSCTSLAPCTLVIVARCHSLD